MEITVKESWEDAAYLCGRCGFVTIRERESILLKNKNNIRGKK